MLCVVRVPCGNANVAFADRWCRARRRGTSVPRGAGFFGHRSPLARHQTSAHASGGGGGCIGGGVPSNRLAPRDQSVQFRRSLPIGLGSGVSMNSSSWSQSRSGPSPWKRLSMPLEHGGPAVSNRGRSPSPRAWYVRDGLTDKQGHMSYYQPERLTVPPADLAKEPTMDPAVFAARDRRMRQAVKQARPCKARADVHDDAKICACHHCWRFDICTWTYHGRSDIPAAASGLPNTYRGEHANHAAQAVHRLCVGA